jgi:ADP-heptose:LPS heptosyltransferase
VAAAERLKAAGFQAAFLGGPGDPEPEVPEAVNWVGRLSLERSMAAVAESALHLCGDTGTGHIAAAYGVPVLSVFGNMDPARYRPYTEKGIVLKEGADAAAVPLARILEAVDSMIERYGA